MASTETIKITFNSQEGAELSARLEKPAGEDPAHYALFAHCFTCNKNLVAVRAISSALTNKGFGVLRFDFTGLGESEGEFSDTNFSSNVEDLISAASFLGKEYVFPSLIIGHSLGGAASIYAASKMDKIRAVATIGAPSDPEHVSHLVQDGLEEIRKSGSATVSIGGRPFKVKQQFLEDLQQKHLSNVLNDMRKAIAIFHSPQDQIVDIDNAAEIYMAAHHPKSFISLDRADHLLTEKRDATYVGEVIATWAARYLM